MLARFSWLADELLLLYATDATDSNAVVDKLAV